MRNDIRTDRYTAAATTGDSGDPGECRPSPTPAGAWSPNNVRRWGRSSPDHPALPFALQPGADPEHPHQFPLTQGLPA